MVAIHVPKRLWSLLRRTSIFGPTLEHTIQAWIKARTNESKLPEAETAQLIAAIVRRLSRVSVITVFLALVPVVFLTWQNVLTQTQIAETRERIVEQARNQRMDETRRLLKEAEERMYSTVSDHFIPKKVTLPLDGSDEFFNKCRTKNSPEQEMISRLRPDAVAYVRNLSEFYLLDIRALNPLSGELSETTVYQRGNADSWRLNQLALSAAPVMTIVEECDLNTYALTRLVNWGQHVDVGEFIRFAKPAADIKLKYDTARQQLDLTEERLLSDQTLAVSVKVSNRTRYNLTNVLITCTVEHAGKDITQGEKSIDRLEVGTHEVRIALASEKAFNAANASVSCRVIRAFADIDILS